MTDLFHHLQSDNNDTSITVMSFDLQEKVREEAEEKRADAILLKHRKVEQSNLQSSSAPLIL